MAHRAMESTHKLLPQRSRSRSKDRDSKNNKNKKSKYKSGSDSDSASSHDRKEKKKKKRHHRSRSVSPSIPGKSTISKCDLTVDQMEKLKELHKKEKEIQKALETPEEKRARRLAKKDAKLRKKKQQMGWDEEYMCYTNADNPFGDEHLHETFVWAKKQEKDGNKHVPPEELLRRQKQKAIDNKIELEKVKRRRLEREREREERDNLHEMEQRDKESEYYEVWEMQEDTFHLNQAKLRSQIRINDGRAKPIDLLAKYIGAQEDDDITVEMHEPYSYLNGLTIGDLEDLLEDISVYREMEQGRNADFWRDMTIISQDELTSLRKIDPTRADEAVERRAGINQVVSEDVAKVFRGKTLTQLAALAAHIERKLQGGEGIDVGYWESLLQQLRAHMARTRLRDKHQDQLRRRLFQLKAQQGITQAANPLFPIAEGSSAKASPLAHAVGASASPAAASPGPTEPQEGQSASDTAAAAVMPPPGDEHVEIDLNVDEEPEKRDAGDAEEQDLLAQPYADYEAGGYSPRLVRPEQLEPDTIVYDPADDVRRLEYARVRVLRIGQAKEESDKEFEKIAREGMNDDEAQFSVEVTLEKQILLWSDKYRPRKPRFFNRVHTGFEWNKYNQTHYDIDNPPPKIVQGYKFNIFYPDLIDKQKTPQYFLTPCDDSKDFGMLRFHAGPPYEDIAFKVVNREWEYSYKRGFRCQFHNNIFQLWYHFKRYRYRR